jgi:hypothetical protein
VVPGDDDLGRVRKVVHPVRCVLKFPNVLAAQVARVHEDISLGDGELAMKGVRIRDRDNPHV